MTAPTIVSGYTTANNTANSLTLAINTPTHSNGDMIVVVYVTDGDSSTASISGTGWSVQEGPQNIPSSAGATAGSFYVWTKTASSEDSSYTITQSVSERAVAMAFAVTNANGINTEATYNSGSDSSAEMNALTTSVADCLRISIIGSTGVRTVSTMTGHTLLATHSYTSAGTISVQYKALSSSGTDSGQTATLDSTYWCSYAFAIAPTSSSVSVTPSDITAGAPSIASAAITQVHAATLTSITTANAQIPDFAIAQKHVAVASDITPGAPTLAEAELGLGYGIPDLYSGAPVLDTAALSQNHSIAASGVTTATPIVGNLPLILAQSFVCNDFSAGIPTLESPIVNERPFYVASEVTSSATGTTTVTLNVPTHIADDLLIAFFAIENGEATTTPDQSGWTEAWKATNASRAHTHVCYYRRAGGSEPASYTWTVSSGEWAGFMSSYRNAGTPYNINWQWNDTPSFNVAAPNITTTADKHMAFAAGSIAYGVTFTPPDSFDERVDNQSGSGSANISVFAADCYFLSAATFTDIYAVSSGSDYSAAGIMAFGPYVIPGSNSLEATGFDFGTPVLDTATLLSNHSLSIADITTSQPTLATVAVFENQVLGVTAIMTGTPDLEIVSMTSHLQLVAIAPSIGPPTVEALAVFQNHALSFLDIETGSPALENFEISQDTATAPENITLGAVNVDTAVLTQVHTLTIFEAISGFPVVGTASLVGNVDLIVNDLECGTPDVEVVSLVQQQVLLVNDIVTSAADVANVTIIQNYDTDPLGITTGQPVVDALGMNGAISLVSVGIAAGQVVLDSAALSQNHNIGAATLNAGTPSLGTVLVRQHQELTMGDLESGTPVLPSLALVQKHIIVASGITTQSVELGACAVTPNKALSATGITTDNPDVSPVPLVQYHQLSATGFESGTPVLGGPSVALSDVLGVEGITTGTPEVEVATATIRRHLTPSDIEVPWYALDNPVVNQHVSMSAVSITTGNAYVGEMQLGEGNTLLPEDIFTGQAEVAQLQVTVKSNIAPLAITTSPVDIEQILVSQHHYLFTSTITTSGPTLGTLRINPGERIPDRRTFSTDERGAYTPPARGMMNVRNYEKRYDVK